MEERLKVLMQDLGNAINESLSDSQEVSAAIENIKTAGYDVFLVLELTIGFSKRDTTKVNENPRPQVGATGEVHFTTQDERFAKILRIDLKKETPR